MHGLADGQPGEWESWFVHGVFKCGYDNRGIKAKPFDIPLGAMITANMDNLMMAGRCISGDFVAHSSYRVTGNAVAMGEYAGVAAAIASKTNAPPHQVAYSEVDKRVTAIRKEHSSASVSG